jgi:signal transduction histidine kinase
MASVGLEPTAHDDHGTAPASDGGRGGSGEAPAPGARAARERTRAPRAQHRELYRYPDRGLIGGVCAGIAERIGADPWLVRFVTVVVILAGGVGIAIYAVAWALVPVAPASHGASRPRGALLRAVSVALAVAAAYAAVRTTGLRFGDTVLWPIVVGACGLALAWRVMTGAPLIGGRGGGGISAQGRPWQSGARALLGAVLLVAFASSALLHTFGVLRNTGKEVGAGAIIAITLALLAGPWAVRVARSLSFERAARIREKERADLAAHLHDSVLQTLALIQKRAADPREVAQLARRQERELRRWLHEGPPRGGRETVAAALARNAAEVEELHRVPIEVVTVGDGPLDAPLEALVQAAREAVTNAAKFARSDHVDLFAEVADGRVEVFVRDRGVGFDPDAIPADRRGVRDSIVARMERHGGRATVRSKPGEGTEVELVMAGGSAA